jgi:uncharacterized protein YkwD
MRFSLLSIVSMLTLVAIGAVVAFVVPQQPTPADTPPQATDALVTTQTATSSKAPVATPEPLRGPKTAKPNDTNLEANGVIASTNVQRAAKGLPPLKFNATLTAAAQVKADDLFAKQYFEHVSPSGTTPTQLIEAAGYKELANGENLAEGNFNGDIALVAAWMASPGHRANILSTHYTEIGVAVVRGTYEGYTTWMAVQEFGKPTSACPAPTAERKLFEAEQAQAMAMQHDLETHPTSTPEEVDDYNQKVEEYNQLVAKIKADVATLNSRIAAFNTCIKG